jgi:hypothetical protein
LGAPMTGGTIGGEIGGGDVNAAQEHGSETTCTQTEHYRFRKKNMGVQALKGLVEIYEGYQSAVISDHLFPERGYKL